MSSTPDNPKPSSSSLLVGAIATPVTDPMPEQISASKPEPIATNGDSSISEPPPNPYAPAPSKMGSMTNNSEESNSRSSSMRSGAPMLVLMVILCVCAIIAIVMLGSLNGTITSQNNQAPATIYINSGTVGSDSTPVAATGSIAFEDLLSQAPAYTTGENACSGASLGFANKDCIVDGMTNVGPQAGANVTKGFKGDMKVDYKPITTSLFKAGLCPVNVHWHLGAEHYSLGEFDENGKGSRKIDWQTDGGSPDLGSFQCHHYDETDAKYTRKYDFKHCLGMEVGQTYEVHWPHSAAGACGTPDQYQNPFYDGVFCNLDLETFNTLPPQDIANSVGVQSQVFTVVNDEQYFRPNLMRGMIVDGDFGKDLAIYTGSSTGSGRSNSVCSPYAPITWQVDRKCQLISASSFDLMCAEMKMQRDDLTNDLIAHGSRPLVSKDLTADNQQNRDRKLRGNSKN